MRAAQVGDDSKSGQDPRFRGDDSSFNQAIKKGLPKEPFKYCFTNRLKLLDVVSKKNHRLGHVVADCDRNT